MGTFALVPQVADAVGVPVIAAGGIADGRGIAAALMLGASAVQIGTAFLSCPEARVHPLHRRALTEPPAPQSSPQPSAAARRAPWPTAIAPGWPTPRPISWPFRARQPDRAPASARRGARLERSSWPMRAGQRPIGSIAPCRRPSCSSPSRARRRRCLPRPAEAG